MSFKRPLRSTALFVVLVSLLSVFSHVNTLAFSPDSLFRGESAITSDSAAAFTLTFGENLATNLTFKKDVEADMVAALGRITFTDEVYAKKAFILQSDEADTQIEIGEAFGVAGIQARNLEGDTKHLFLNPHGSGVVIGDPTQFDGLVGEDPALSVAGAIRLGTWEPEKCSDGSLRWGECAVEVCYLGTWHKIMTEDNTCSGIQDPTEISGLVTWYDGNDIDGDGAAEGQYEYGLSGVKVDRWVDKGPNGYHATQSTQAFKPEVDFNVLNNKPVIVFDGADDYLQETSYTGLEDENEYSIFFVANFDDVDQTLLSMTNNADQNGILLSSAGTEQLLTLHRYPFGTTGGDTVVASGLDSGYPHVGAVVRSNDGFLSYVDDGANYTAATSQAAINQIMQLTLGKQNSADDQFELDGYIAEILIYNRALNDIEQQTAVNYLQKKWLGSEVPVTANLVLHLDATRIGLSNGANISTWEDISGNDNHASQDGKLRPKLRTAGINGLPAVEFANDSLVIDDHPSLESTAEMTTFIVARTAAIPNGARGILSKREEDDEENAYSIYTTGQQRIGYDVNGDNNSIATISSLGTNQEYLITTVFDGTATASQRGKIFLDAQLDIATGFSPTNIPNTDSDLFIGVLDEESENGFRGKIGEIMMFDRALTEEEIEAVHTYLNNKWQL